eukprot:4128140-Alexandrium_andersonii.AAC.1
MPRVYADLETCALLDDRLRSMLPGYTHWAAFVVGSSVPYSVVRALRASGSAVFGTVSRCGTAGCVWRLSPEEYAEAVAPR